MKTRGKHHSIHLTMAIALGACGLSLATTDASAAYVTQAQYNFDSESGGVVQDISGNHHDLTISSPQLSSDNPHDQPGNYSLVLDGSTDSQGLISNIGTIDLYGDGSTQNRFTLEAWIKPTTDTEDNGYAVELTSTTNATTLLQLIRTNQNLGGRAYVASSGTSTVDTGVAIPTNKWSHIALEWHKGSSLNFYLNGELVKSYGDGDVGNLNRNLGAVMPLTSGVIGRSFIGLIDDVRISRGLVPSDELGYYGSYTVPEPASMMLLAVGGLLLVRHKREATGTSH